MAFTRYVTYLLDRLCYWFFTNVFELTLELICLWSNILHWKWEFPILHKKLVFWQLIFFNSSFTFSGIRCTSAGSEHAVWGAFGARGGGTLMVKEGAPLSGYWNTFKDYYCILHSLILFSIYFYLKKII